MADSEALLQTLDSLAAPATRDALIQKLSEEKARLEQELASLPEGQTRNHATQRIRAIDDAFRLVGATTPTRPVPSDDAIRFFESKVRPVFIEHCQSCHGPDKQKSNLRLDSLSAIMKGGDHGPALALDDSASSILVTAVQYTGEIKMPPDSRLPDDAIAAIVEWVKMGAPWPSDSATTEDAKKPAGIDIAAGREWWAFKPVQNHAPPRVADAAWVKNAVDAFILAQLEKQGISPAAPADKRTLIRRATFDLIGLPPTPAEIDAFLADNSQDAFAKVVERLLASPHYGERWGRHWLDVVRYTDSFDSRAGATTDPVNSWRYRDWVINAFNTDMPYDEFVKYQIAGDLLPDPANPQSGFNRDGTIATAMLAIGNWPQGDADKQKMVADIVDDQIDVVTRGILGVTMGCARCHDHKFDPFTTEDYYGLAGIFFSSHILPGPGQKTEGSPILHIPLIPPAEAAARDAHVAKIGELDKRSNDETAALRAQAMPAMLGQTAQYIGAAWDFAQLQRSDASADINAFAQSRTLNTDALARWMNLLALSPLRALSNPVHRVSDISGLVAWQGEGGVPSAVINTTVVEQTYATIKHPARTVTVHPSPAAGVGVSWRSPVSTSLLVNGRVADADGTCGNGVIWRVELRKGDAMTTLAEGVFENAGKSDIASPEIPIGPVDVSVGDRILLVIEPRMDYSCDTTALDLTLTDASDNTKVWNLTADALVNPLQSNPLPDNRNNGDVWTFVDLANASMPADSPLNAWYALEDKSNRAAMDTVIESLQGNVNAAVAALAQAGNDIAKLPDDANTRLYTFLVSDKGPYWIDPATLTDAAVAADRERLQTTRTELAALRAKPFADLDYTEGVQEGGTPNTEHEGIRDVRVHRRGNYNQLGDVVPRRFPVVLASDVQQPIAEGSGRRQLAQWVGSEANPLTARVMTNRIWQQHFGEGIVRTPGNFGKQGTPPKHAELLDYLASEFVASGWSMKAMHRLIMLSSTYQQSSSPSAPGIDPDNQWFGRVNRRRLEAEPLRDAMLAVTGKLDLTVGGKAFPDLMTPRRTVYFRTVRSDRTSYTMLFDAADPTTIIDKRTETTVAPQALFLINNPFVLEQARQLSLRVQSLAVSSDADRIRSLYPILLGRDATNAEQRVGERVIANARASFPNDEPRALQEYCQILLCSNEFAFID